MNLQVEPRTIIERTLIKIPEADSPTYKHLYMYLSSQRSRGWNLVFCKEVLLVSLWNIILLGDLRFSWGEEGLSCWEDDARSDQWVVILSSTLSINKAIWVFLHILVCLSWYMHLCGQYIFGPILFMSVDLYALMVLCCFDFTGAIWSGARKGGVEKICQRGEETSKEPSERLRLVLSPSLSSTSHKGKQKYL